MQIINNKNKNTHRRLDRITTTFDVNSTSTYVANPLGGAIYIRVPYLADLGQITVNITGGVVEAPFFRKGRVATTTDVEWTNDRQVAPGAWMDFETDNFLMQVPRSWTYLKTFGEMDTLANEWNLAMDGVSELFGFPYDRRNDYVLYVNPVSLFFTHYLKCS